MALSLDGLQSEQKLLFCAGNYSWVHPFCVENNVEEAIILYQNNFVNSDGLTFNKKTMEKYVDAMIPDKDAYGYAILDWEGYIFNVIKGTVSVSADTYKTYLYEFIKAIRYAKHLRPNIKWSLTGFPTMYYTQFSLDKTNFQDVRLSLLKELDFLNPVYYMFYRDASVDDFFNSQYVYANIKYSIDLGIKLKKEVYPVIWHRYTPSIYKTNDNLLMPYSVYKEYIKYVLNTTLYGKRVDGIVWWSCEDFLYKTRTSDPIIAEEYKNVTDYNAYRDNLMRSYLDTTRLVIDQINNQ